MTNSFEYLFCFFYLQGAWVCLNNISAIQPPVLSVLTQLVTVVLDGLKASKSTVVLHDDEITLAPQGACFGTLDYSTDQHKTEYEPSVGFFPSFKSSASFLPVDLWDMFRPVALVGPDLQVIIQVWLLSQGFTQVSSLASKIVTLRSLCLQLLPSSSKPLSADLCLCLQKCIGWGAYSLKRMIEDAGSHLGASSEELHVSAPEHKGPSHEEGDAPDRAESPTEAVGAVNAPLEALRQDGKMCPKVISALLILAKDVAGLCLPRRSQKLHYMFKTLLLPISAKSLFYILEVREIIGCNIITKKRLKCNFLIWLGFFLLKISMSYATDNFFKVRHL